MAKLVAKILARVGKHANKQGQERYNEVVIANIFQNEKGHQSVKFLSFPAGDWDGWARMVRPDYECEHTQFKHTSRNEEDDGQLAFL
jgi:hypothetical protein